MSTLPNQLLRFGREIIAELKAMNASLFALHNEVEAITKQEKTKNSADNKPLPPIISVLTTPTTVQVDAETHERKDIWHRLFTVIETLGVVAVVVYAILTYFTLEQMTRSTEAVEETARISYHQAIIAGNSFKANAKQFRETERPYMWLSGNPEAPQIYRLPADVPPSAHVVWNWHHINYGKSPAIRTRIYSIVDLGENAKDRRHACGKTQFTGIASPTEQAMSTGASEKPVTPEEFQRLMKLNGAIVLFGCLDYEDSDGQSYKSRFCIYWRGDGQISYCPREDENYIK